MRRMTVVYNCQGRMKANPNKQNQQEFTQAAHGQPFSHKAELPFMTTQKVTDFKKSILQLVPLPQT